MWGTLNLSILFKSVIVVGKVLDSVGCLCFSELDFFFVEIWGGAALNIFLPLNFARLLLLAISLKDWSLSYLNLRYYYLSGLRLAGIQLHQPGYVKKEELCSHLSNIVCVYYVCTYLIRCCGIESDFLLRR